MKHDDDMELYHLFAERPQPGNGDRFVSAVLTRITQRRRLIRTLRCSAIVAGIVVLAILQPWFINVTTLILRGSGFIAQGITTFAISPFGWLIGWWMGLTLLLRLKS